MHLLVSMKILCQFTKSYHGCKLLCHNNCSLLTFQARVRGLLNGKKSIWHFWFHIWNFSKCQIHIYYKKKGKKSMVKENLKRAKPLENNSTYVLSGVCQNFS